MRITTIPDPPAPPDPEEGRWFVHRQHHTKTDWALVNQHWSAQIVPTTQANLAQILQTPPALPEFAAAGIHLPRLGSMSTADIGRISTGQAVSVTSDAAPGRIYEGVVTRINITGTTVNGVTSYPVTIRIDKTEGLLPGMNVDARIVVEDLRDVLLVPVGAVMRNNFVLLQVQGQDPETAEPGIPAGFVQTEVTLGASNDNIHDSHKTSTFNC